MATVAKSIRLTAAEWEQLDGIAAETGHSLSRTVAALASEWMGHHGAPQAVTEEPQGEPRTECGGRSNRPAAASGAEAVPVEEKVIDALTTQLAEKDAQISRLMDALQTAQEATKAAQTLHAATVDAKALATRKGGMAGIWARLTRRDECSASS